MVGCYWQEHACPAATYDDAEVHGLSGSINEKTNELQLCLEAVVVVRSLHEYHDVLLSTTHGVVWAELVVAVPHEESLRIALLGARTRSLCYQCDPPAAQLPPRRRACVKPASTRAR
mmetsp:Transcript_72411/g.212169  ORF Transcript_72411/g.212169 Transcript_72411/m.212169 type:complete len:117 (+) Transcript_72411:457-807(+)